MTLAKLSKSLIWNLVVITLVAFAVLNNIRWVIHNNELNERIKKVGEAVERQENQNRKLALLINYYQTPSFQEVEARRRLGLQLPGEKVFVIEGVDTKKYSGALSRTIYENVELAPAEPTPNFVKWWQYFFGD